MNRSKEEYIHQLEEYIISTATNIPTDKYPLLQHLLRKGKSKLPALLRKRQVNSNDKNSLDFYR